MSHPQIQNLNKRFNTGLAILAALIISISLSFLYGHKKQILLKKTSRNKYHSYLLADRLRQSSDDLTRLVRTYAATGNPLYQEQFYKILDIRNGKAPRPKNYNLIYWDLIIHQNDTPPFGFEDEPIALQELMKQAGFSKHEFDLVKESEFQSNKLVLLEEEAMNALNGVFKDENGKYTITGKPNKEKAISILHGEEYHEAKKAIMLPLNSFFDLLEKRTSEQVQTQEKHLLLSTYSLGIHLFLILSVLGYLYYLGKLRNRILVKTLEQQVALQTKEINNSKELLEEQNKLLNNKNKELEQFVYIASHDLQEPLNSIISFNEILSEEYNGKLNELGDKCLNVIDQSANRMREFIKGLLEYSRIGRDKETELVDMNDLIDYIRTDLSRLIELNSAQIINKKLPTIKAFPTDIHLLFQNLITNAIRYKKETELPIIEISHKENRNSHEFAVKDNGIGIAKESQKKIFEIFQRLHTRDKYEGTGIGLAHCKKIIEHHKGDIWIDSIVGSGTTFYFTISKNPEK